MRSIKALTLGLCTVLATWIAATAAPIVAAASAPSALIASPCGPDQRAVTIAGSVSCTHGDDAVPPKLPRTGLRTLATTSLAPCAGNGRNGPRIHVLLGVPADTTEADPATDRQRIRDAVALADANLDATSAEVGQHYRFYCRHDRSVTVPVVQLPAVGADASYTFEDVAKGLGKLGLTASSTIYAVFVANIDCCYPYGGQGSVGDDDSPDPATNWNNGPSPRYSMIRLGTSWDAATLALVFQHETGHNMGAVQNSAPHTSGAYHCYETNDVMCYNDGGPYFIGGGSLVSVCPGLSTVGMYVFDCGGDDYYNAAPDAHTYLADHWDVSRSRWLTPVGAAVS